jgi:hypothetical protein
VILLFFVPGVSEAASTVDSLWYPILFLYQFFIHCVAANKSQLFFAEAYGGVEAEFRTVSDRLC